jgi:hypothetical protein
MKWNWGTKLVLAMAAFMIMVIVFVVLMMRENISLVEEDYYPKGQVHQELVEKKRNASSIGELVRIEKINNEVRLVFPEQFKKNQISGTVHFYHRIDDRLDETIVLSNTDSIGFIFPLSDMQGRYIAKIDWVYDGVAYYIEKSIELP